MEIYEEETLSTKMAKHAKRNPFLMAGFASFIGACAYGVHQFKKRGNVPISVYILQYRVIAQSSVIGCLTVGMLYHLVNDQILNRDKKE